MNDILFLVKLLNSDKVSYNIEINFDILLLLIPEINYIVGFKQNHPHHHLDVWNHTLLALENSENDFDIRLTLLLHDIGKPFSFSDGEDGVRHFHGHAKKSADIALLILRRMKFNEEYIDKIIYLIKNHDTIIGTDIINDRELEIKRLKVQYADAKAHSPNTVKKRLYKLDEISNIINMFHVEH